MCFSAHEGGRLHDMHCGIVLLKFSHPAPVTFMHTLPYPTLRPAYLGLIAYIHTAMHTCGVHRRTGWLAREGGREGGTRLACRQVGTYVRCIYNLQRLKRGCKATGVMRSNLDRHWIQIAPRGGVFPCLIFFLFFSHAHLPRSVSTVGKGGPPPLLG